MLTTLRHRNFALLWSGQAVSLLGDGIFMVALPVEALRLSHGPALLSYVVAARTLPMVVLLLPAGAITDRTSRRLTMLASDLVRGVAVLLVALLVALHHLHPVELVIMAAAFGSADAFFFPASTAIVPEIVPSELLTPASSLSFTSEVLAQSLVGPAVGGVLIGVVGISGCVFVDAASFAVSALALTLMRRLPGPQQSERRSMLAETKEGLRYTFQRSNRWLWVTLMAASVANFATFTPLAVLTPLLVEHVLGGSPAALGFILATGGLGGLAGVLIAGRARTPKHRMAWMLGAWTLGSASVAVRAFVPDLTVLAILAVAGGGLLYYGSTLWVPLMQQLVPSELLGRVSSVDWLFSLSLSPVGVLLAGVLAAGVGVRLTTLIGGSIGTLAGVIFFVPGVLDPDRVDRVDRGVRAGGRDGAGGAGVTAGADGLAPSEPPARAEPLPGPNRVPKPSELSLDPPIHLG